MEDFEYMQVAVHVSGDGFKPEVLQDRYKPMELHISASTGKIANIGKYRGKPSPYGSCYFIVPKTIKHENKISIATVLYHRIKQLNNDDNLSIDKIQVDIVFSGVQGNMHLTHEELKDLAGTNSTVIMNYIQLKGDDPDE
jgi:hypothetical protein